MRTKTLFLSAATLLAGLISTQAQNVYSVNIVGYVNVPARLGFANMGNPLDAQVSNSASNVIQNAFDPISGQGPWDGSQVQIWNGTQYTVYFLDSNPADFPPGQFTGYTDTSGNPLSPPVLGPGVGFLFNNQTASSNVLTFVGAVRGQNGAVISNNVSLPTNPLFNYVSSALPLAGGVSSSLQLSNVFDNIAGQGPLDGCQIQVPNINNSGQLTFFSVFFMDSNPDDYPPGQFTGFTDTSGNPLPEPQIPMGSGFFFVNQAGSTVQWKQVLNLQ